MKKKISIVLIIIIIFLISNLTFADISNSDDENLEKLMLPKIPIYIENNFSNFSSDDILVKVSKSQDSFYNLRMRHKMTKYRNKLISGSGSYMFAFGFGGGALGLLIDWAIASNEATKHYVDGSSEDFETSKYFNFTFTTIGTLLGIGYTYLTSTTKSPYLDIYRLELYRNKELLNTQTCNVLYRKNVKSNIINNFIMNSDQFLSNYSKLGLSINNYNQKQSYFSIESNYNKIITTLEKPKGEFETTTQYDERTRKEQNRKKELQAKMEQEISIVKEKKEIEKFALLQEIKKEMSEIEFTKFYDFEISNFNADRQSFTVNISNTEKEIVIPIAEAPSFKKNTNILSVQKTLRPTLNGEWKTISDGFVLFNTKTDEIIPWEGSIPTFVKTAVENPPILSASIKLIEPSGEGFLDAEETAVIQVTLTNSGKGSAKMTRISLFQQEGPTLYYNVSNTINEILPNQSITSEFKLSIPENIENESVKFKVSFIEEQGFEPAPLTFTAETREMPKPELQFIDFGVEDANGDGKISKGETADITLRLQNIGYGKANQVVLKILENRLNNVFIISDKHFELGELESGESKDIIFTISTNNRVSDIVDIYFSITEKRPQFSIEDIITLEFERNQKQLEPIVFVGKDIRKEIEYSNDLSIDIEHNIPKSKESNKNALAIIFGIEEYRNVSNVNFAFRDATIMKEYFSKALGIPEEQIYFRANDEVTLGEFRKIFSKNGWLDKRIIENETDIYFYYAGHGAPAIKEEKAFLIPFDGDPNYPVQTGYSLETVFENLSKLKANSVTVFLDACFTGANRENEMLLAGARPVSIQLKNNYVNNVTVFSATSSNEISSSYPKNKHGLFSYFLMKGMQGEADENNDNKITIQELFDFTKSNVSKIAGTLDREQTPQLECLEPEKIIINY